MKPKMESNTATLAVIGVDIGKEVFTSSGSASTGRSPSGEDQAIESHGRVREAAAVHRRHGSLPERAFRQQDVAGIGTSHGSSRRSTSSPS
jgi:hypothetical protein